MSSYPLAPFQKELIERPVHSKIFLEGQVGSGKTTVGAGRMLELIRRGVPASSLLILVPQRTLALPYTNILRTDKNHPGGQVAFLTVGGLARRMVDLFWPLLAEENGFNQPEIPPSFLTLETALYYMAYLVRPLLDQGLFDSVTIDRNRLYSQVLDNLNKAAIVGFPYTEISQRLRNAWTDDTAQANVVEDAQRCANLFREYCLQNNLLDYSLQVEIFSRYLWKHPACRAYLEDNYQHLIYDNVEEDMPVAHDIVRSWLPKLESALIIYDQDAGYRRFLGADPQSAVELVRDCEQYDIFSESLVAAPALQSFGMQLGQALELAPANPAAFMRSEALSQVLCYPDHTLRFFPQMLDWVVDGVERLVQGGTPPGEIVLLAPLLPDSLRYALSSRLEARRIPHRSHRPSRSLREEPAAQALLTLASIAHPEWGIRPSQFEVAYAMLQVIEGLDLVRSQLLVEAAYRTTQGMPALTPFQKIRPELQERITYSIGNRYEDLRQWIEAYIADPVVELDYFFSRLFGEILSQPGFSFHSNFTAGTVCQNLIESAQKFRWAVGDRIPVSDNPELEPNPLGKEYLAMIQDGILAAQYIQSWQIPDENAVLIAPAYTFLLANQAVDYQFWIDVGSSAWAERLYQPLTHPIILSRQWPAGRVWTDVDEYEYNRDTLYRLVLGLTRRCRKQVYLGLCEIGEGGFESRGMLLRAIQIVLQQSRGYQR
jgi:hypothetical protein